MSQSRRAFLEKLDEIAPGLARAFEASVADIRSSAQLRALEDAIAAQDIARAFEALRLDEAFWAPLDRAIDEAFYSGGVWGLSKLPPKSLQNTGLAAVRFQGRHPRAEAWVKNAAGKLIREITEDQQKMVRGAILRGLETGRGPRSLALDLVGRIEGNSRKGGLIGLTSKQAEWVQGARRQLEDLDRGYFERTLRDRRFDATVRRAIREGKPLAEADMQSITARYADRMLKMRGETIARTETLSALNAGRMEGVRQLVESGQVPASAVTRRWRATIGSGRTRDSHASLHGQTVGLNEPFVSPLTGARMMHPGDTSLGAPASETVQCRCDAEIVIDWSSLAR